MIFHAGTLISMQDKNENKLSQDQMIKNLVRDYPADDLEFFYPEILKRYGKPSRVDFHIQETKKHTHFDKNLKNDLAVIYEFDNGKHVVLMLMEHWSDKSQFDIHRFAHYLIDLDNQFPEYEKLPVALFTDSSDTWRKEPQRKIEIRCLDEVFLVFHFKLMRMKSFEAKEFIETKNRFIAALRSAMKWDKSDKIILALDFIKGYMLLEERVKVAIKNIDIIEYFLYINKEEKLTIAELLRENRDTNMTIVQEFIKEGEIKGRLEGKLDDARKMINKGFIIEDILEITELYREDLINAGIIKK